MDPRLNQLIEEKRERVRRMTEELKLEKKLLRKLEAAAELIAPKVTGVLPRAATG